MASSDGEKRLSELWVAMASWRGAAHFGKKAGRTRTEALFLTLKSRPV